MQSFEPLMWESNPLDADQGASDRLTERTGCREPADSNCI